MKKFIILLLFLMHTPIFPQLIEQAEANLYYETYRGTGAYPNMPYYGTGTLTYPSVLSSGTVTAINHNWGSGSVLNSGRSEQVLVKYWGYIYVPGSGTQTLTFYNSSDDGFYLRVNDQTVINNWVEQGNYYYNSSGSITLTGGQYYAIEAWYYENGGGAVAQLFWNQSGAVASVPTSSYYLTQPPPPPVYTSNITTAQQSRVDAFRARTSTEASIHIEQVGDNNNITIVQKGAGSIKGIGQDRALIDGDTNSITIRQGVSATGNNEIKLRVVGNTNTLNLNQANTTQGITIGGNGHYLYTDIYGNLNTLTTQQSNTGGVGGHYAETTISGNSNNVTHLQTGNGNKIMFTNIVGSNNTVSANQKDTGQHYLDLKLTGNGHNANIIQDGTASHRATIDLTNAGGASSITLNQNSNTTGQVYSIQQSCANAAGCATTVTQNQ